ncbi:TlpA disulfide reductase family protein [Chryseolinea sp. H1M3-3]|uniref:TlpA disulfide reductase family protein n=1 Tax=Chryseolinea sp. H1M3-3 TaxID=3034144 RepID=UPI0023ECC525|nr:TlpA disulfide reductase family protein [Chryseolinea sp. H1M3-3]
MDKVCLVTWCILLFGCSSKEQASVDLKSGIWRATVEIQGKELPFNFDVQRDGNKTVVYLINAEERLLLDEVKVDGDSVDIVMHIFDANIKARLKGDTLEGLFIKNFATDYRLPFQAVHGQWHRFNKSTNQLEIPDFSGKYEVKFVHEADTTPAIAIFKQAEDSVTGTFLTPTGDYRFLQGNVVNGTLHLSTFDGNYAYLFTAAKQLDGSLVGEYYSGKTWKESWTARRNDNASLPDADKLTYLKEGYERVEFNFPDVNGNNVSLNDDKYKNKVVVLQIFGTWCPNCMDETKFLAPWYRENKGRGVEIIGLAYERKPDFTYASNRVKKMVDKLNVSYDFVIAGTDDKDKASETLPMLNRVVAFPTTIFIGKDGKVKKIHTGFSGPSTGIYYEQYKEQFNQTVNELLAQDIALK